MIFSRRIAIHELRLAQCSHHPLHPLDRGYRNTQNVRRFLTEACGPNFHFDRPFMAWLKSGEAKTMGQVADHWNLLHRR